VLRADALASLDAQALASRVLRPHPATRWAWFEAMPIASLWMRQRAAAQEECELPWQGEGLLLTRDHEDAVRWALLPQAGCVLLDACAAGATLGEAAGRAVEADAQADLREVIAQLIAAGAFIESAAVGFSPFTATLRTPIN